MPKALDQYTPQERAAMVGTWVEVVDYGWVMLVTKSYDIVMLLLDLPTGYAGRISANKLIPRPDLPRAFNPDGTPPDGDWEHITLQDHPRGGWNGRVDHPEYFDEPAGTTMRRWTTHWEKTDDN